MSNVHARIFVRIALVGPLVTVVLLGLATVPGAWWAGPDGVLVALGGLAGLTGTVLLLQSVALTSRFGPLERAVGLGTMLGWHRRLATVGLVLVTLHVVLTVAGLARREGRGLLPQTWDLLLTWPDMVPAAAALLLLVGVAVLSARIARRRMRYELWWAVHLYSYLALGLALLHQLSSGAAFGAEAWEGSLAGAVLDDAARATAASVVRGLWLAGYALTLALVLWYRIAVPALRSRRHALRVAEVEPLAGGAVRVALAGRRLHRLGVVGGQFAQFRFARRGMLWQAHPYSFSGLPERSRVHLTLGGGGDYARAVAGLAPGTRVYFEGPYGTMTARAALEGASRGRTVLVLVGGLGVTPICSLLCDLPPFTRPVVVYRVRQAVDAVDAAELRRLTTGRQGRLHVLVGPREEHPMTAETVGALVPDAADRHVYICGSRGFVEEAGRAVRELGVPAGRVTTEAFAW